VYDRARSFKRLSWLEQLYLLEALRYQGRNALSDQLSRHRHVSVWCI
jgi:hypothetical protein